MFRRAQETNTPQSMYMAAAKETHEFQATDTKNI